jgi:predicted TIM-barrel fold metal-dependent hydrolase
MDSFHLNHTFLCASNSFMAIYQLQTHTWKYSGPIFDAHTHVWSTTHIAQTVKEQIQLGIKSQLVIAHLSEVQSIVEAQFPGKLIFAKYLSTQDIIASRIERVLSEIDSMRDNGFSLAKMWAAPGWRNYLKNYEVTFQLTDQRYQPIFIKLASEGFPLLLHMADPDTYYATNYANSRIYGTKDEHLNELETLIQNHPDLQFQLAHFAAQPEIHRLPHLAEWFDNYDNIVVDTASSRWMARELSKDPDTAREFLIRFSKRVLFGTDAILNTSPTEDNQSPLSPYKARFVAQRILWETSERHTPLPFPDKDTEASGGTFINGLNLPNYVLNDLYWRNAQRLYGT